MKHDKIENDFSNREVRGPSKDMSISDALVLALGWSSLMPKRLSPAGTICNARVYCGKDGAYEFVYKSDLNILKSAHKLSTVAAHYGCELLVFGESGSSYYWSSATPKMWLGGHEEGGEWKTDPVHFDYVTPQLEKHAAQQQRQWQLDHGIVNRNLHEYTSDLKWRWTKYGRYPYKDFAESYKYKSRYDRIRLPVIQPLWWMMKYYLGVK